MKFAARMSNLGAEGFASVLAEVERLKGQGRRLIPMHAGEPDFDTPAYITEAAIAALHDGDTHYVPAAGTMALRAAIAEEVSASRGASVTAEQVVVTPGAKPMIYLAMAALCQAGDEVICPDPSYPIYTSLAAFLGATPVSLPLSMESAFSFDPEQFRALVTPRTRLIVLNSPSNPTGGMLSADDLAVVAELAQAHDLYVLADEIYSDLVYDEPFASILSLPRMAERTIVVDGYSKRYAMTGWRLGYGVMPRALAQQVVQLVLNIFSCTTSFIQPAGVAALQDSQAEVDAMVAAFRRRRDRVVKGLNAIPGFDCLSPRGAFYAFPRVAELGLSSVELSHYLLHKAGVVTYPGTAFGRRGEGFLRFSFACSETQIEEGLQRVAAAIGELG